LEWDGKPTEVERLSLPFQTVETINESRATRQRDEGALDFGTPTDTSERNLLVWGDNQLVMGSLLKQYAGQIKLIYIDPPFDTGADFSVRVKVGDDAITKLPSILEEHAYRDTWGSGQASYLTMLYERLVLMHELLSEDGSLYVHLAPNVSHAVKLVLDEVFGVQNFRSEIIWKRTTAHSDALQGGRLHGRVHDVLLFYSRGEEWTWNPLHLPYDEQYLAAKYGSVEPETGRRYHLDNLTGPGGAEKGNPSYEVMGVTRHWRYSKERMQELIAQGRIVQPRPGAVPRYKRYLDEMPGVPLQDVWADLPAVNSQADERLVLQP
jgi:adenine specific DNA methylase Mod